MLSLALTRKSKQTSAFEDMCGFPMASLDSYVEKLVLYACFSLAAHS
jgi:DNA mismatch repair ATPase MutS